MSDDLSHAAALAVLRSEVADLKEATSRARTTALKWSLRAPAAALVCLLYTVPELGVASGLVWALLIGMVIGTPPLSHSWYLYVVARDRMTIRRGDLETRLALVDEWGRVGGWEWNVATPAPSSTGSGSVKLVRQHHCA